LWPTRVRSGCTCSHRKKPGGHSNAIRERTFESAPRSRQKWKINQIVARAVKAVERESDMSGFDRTPSPAMKRRSEVYRLVNDEVRFQKKRANTESKEPFAMTDFEYAIAEQRHAEAMYPDLPPYKALAKWLATSVGQRVNAAKVRDGYERQQR